MDGDPLWGWVIGPPGSMKTEILRSLEGHDDVFFLSSLTPQALISGYERPDGEDPSLLPRFNGKLVVIKEFTSVIQLPEAHVRQIFGDLRSAYDGFHSKGFGSVGVRQYRSRFCMLAAVTPAIDKYTLVHTDLGERFIALRIGRGSVGDFAERSRVAQHVWAAADTKSIWREALKITVQAAVDELRNAATSPLPATPPEARDSLIALADFMSLLRTVSDDPLAPTSPEIASRTTQQAKYLAAGRARADNRQTVDDTDLDFVRRVIYDTIPTAITRTVRYLYNRQKPGEPAPFIPLWEAAKALQIPLAWLNHLARQYSFCRLLNVKGDTVRCTDEIRTRIEQTRLLQAGPPAHSRQS